jgi:ABC-type uncharacterized transport system fused permease/ATPase subunit
MTYPDIEAPELGEEELLRMLKAMDLGYLLEREGVLTDQVNWEDELSLGKGDGRGAAGSVILTPGEGVWA